MQKEHAKALEKANKHKGQLVPIVHKNPGKESLLEEGYLYLHKNPGKEALPKYQGILNLPQSFYQSIENGLIETDLLGKDNTLYTAWQTAKRQPVQFDKHLLPFECICKHLFLHMPQLSQKQKAEISTLVSKTPIEIDLDSPPSEPFYLTAQTSKDHNQKTIETLLQAGAKFQKGVLDIPKYDSWAEIKPFAKLVLDKENYILEYSPYTNKSFLSDKQVTKDNEEVFRTYANLSSGLEITQQTIDNFQQVYKQEILQKSKIGFFADADQDQVKEICSLYHQKEAMPFLKIEIEKPAAWKKRQNAKLPYAQFVEGIYDFEDFQKWLHKVMKGSYPDEEEIFRKIERGQAVIKTRFVPILDIVGRWGENAIVTPSFADLKFKAKLKISYANQEDIDGSFVSKYTGDCTLPQSWQQKGQGVFVKTKATESFEQRVLKALQAKLGQTIWVSSPPSKETWSFDKYTIAKLLLEEIFDYNLYAGDRSLEEVLLKTLMHMDNKVHNQQKKLYKMQIAPVSEQGKLAIRAKNGKVQTLEKILLDLQNMGFVAWEKPKEKIGRVNPVYDPTYSKVLNIPAEHLILHGLTGASNKETRPRLEKIIEHGGLLSFSERRHHNIKTKTLSPIGDLASGIDHGVPCTINTKPSYGENMFFVMKPSVLNRKHIFFADKDYGGGHNRFEDYQKYAQSLGHNCFLEPPSYDARQKHLSGLKKETTKTNEVWFRWQIALQEIEAIVVHYTLYQDIKKIVEAVQKKGSLPQDIKLYAFQPDDLWDVSFAAPCLSVVLKTIYYQQTLQNYPGITFA